LGLFLGPLFGRAVAAGLPLVIGLVVGSALFAAATPATSAATTAPTVGGPIGLLLVVVVVGVGVIGVGSVAGAQVVLSLDRLRRDKQRHVVRPLCGIFRGLKH